MNIKEAYLKGFEAGYEFKMSAGEVMGNDSIAQLAKKAKKKRKRGKNRGKAWSAEEDEILLANPEKTPIQLMKFLPGREKRSVMSRRYYLKTHVSKRKKKEVDNYEGLVNLGQKLDE